MLSKLRFNEGGLYEQNPNDTEAVYLKPQKPHSASCRPCILGHKWVPRKIL